VVIVNTEGQTVLHKDINYDGNGDVKTIYLNKYIAKGVYVLEILGPDKSISKINFENQ
jgi:hypothetical protein